MLNRDVLHLHQAKHRRNGENIILGANLTVFHGHSTNNSLIILFRAKYAVAAEVINKNYETISKLGIKLLDP